MKKKIIVISVIIIIIHSGINKVNGQAKESNGQQFINLIYSMNGNSSYVTGGYERIIIDNIGLKGDFSYEKGKINLMEENNFLLNAGAKYTIYKLKNISYTSVGAGICVGEEFIKNKELGSKKMNLCYGGSISVNSDVFVAKRLSLGLSFRQYYFQKSIIGKFSYLVGLNIRFRI